MIIYNVTVNIEDDVHEDWITWMKTTHIPEVMSTGYFLENKIAKVSNSEVCVQSVSVAMKRKPTKIPSMYRLVNL